MTRVKKGHYVSQFYLKAFSEDEKSLFVFDKATKKTFLAAISNVACENQFYDLPPCPVPGGDFQAVEKGFADLEGDFATALHELLAEVERDGRFNPNAPGRKHCLSHMIAFQHCRTRQFRDMYAAMLKRVSETVAQKNAFMQKHMEHQGKKVEAQAVDLTTPTEMATLEHAGFMFLGPFLHQAVPIMMGHIWAIGENKSNHPFFTSDAPVLLHAHSNHRYGGGGFRSKGIEIIFPLSSRYVLFLWERSFFTSMQSREGSVIPIPADEVLKFNNVQVYESYRYVYSPSDQFEKAHQFIVEFPALSQIDRPRFLIG